MNDILPPRKSSRPSLSPKPPAVPVVQPPLAVTPRLDIEHQPISEDLVPDRQQILKKPSKKKYIAIALGIIGALILGTAIAAIGWYTSQLAPATDDRQILVAVDIPLGTSPTDIGKILAEKTIIRSSLAFDIYTHLSGVRPKLQAGTYRLAPSDSMSAIVEHLVNGRSDQFQLTFLPGATLDQHKKVLLKAGYTQAAIDEAFRQTYSSPLFGGVSPNDLEGYIYGETYNFGVGASVSDILQFTFDEFYKVIEENDLVDKFSQQGLTLRQGIILASIIQREALTYDDMRQVAQVFLLRLKIGMNLGSDVTYQYITDKLGVPRDINFNSPYNTRRFAGLPPGPIASPSKNALQAVADPADGDFLFFLSGDDDVTYFAHSDAEHRQNIADHCKIKCSTL